MFVAPRLIWIELRPVSDHLFFPDPLKFFAYCSGTPYASASRNISTNDPPPELSNVVLEREPNGNSVLSTAMCSMHPGWKGVINFMMYLMPKFRSPTVKCPTRHIVYHVARACRSISDVLKCLLDALLQFFQKVINLDDTISKPLIQRVTTSLCGVCWSHCHRVSYFGYSFCRLSNRPTLPRLKRGRLSLLQRYCRYYPYWHRCFPIKSHLIAECTWSW